MKVSIFKSILPYDPVDVELSLILKRFKEKDKNGITGLRELSEDGYKEAKNKLPVVCFGGTFSYRANNKLKEASGLMILDFDGVEGEFRNKLIEDEFIYSVFLSPSGRGFKALVKIPIVKDDAEYKEFYYAFMKRYTELDTSGQDICRACFYSYDPELLIKPEAKTWTTKTKTVNVFKRKSTFTDYKIVNKVLNIIRYAIPGERNKKIVKASKLMGGYVASGKVDYDEAIRLLTNEAEAVNPFDKTNQQAVRTSIEYGIKEPITEKKEKELISEETEHKHGKIYFTAYDLNDEIQELYEKGQQRGHVTGLHNLDKLYSIKPGSTTYIYGEPYCGKTQFWFEILIRISELHGLKHLIFSPETGRGSEIFAELIAMRARGDFYNTFGKQISVEAKDKAKDFIDKHFIIIDPSDHVLTIEDIYTYADIVERIYEAKLATVTIDPWNEIRHDFTDFNNRQDQYLEWILGSIRDNARVRNRHNCIITHITDQVMQKKDNIYFYPPPTFRQIAGGQAWSRKGMGMISVWRPKEGLKNEHGMPYEQNETIAFIQKAKPKGIGKIGKAHFQFNINEHRYQELDTEIYLGKNGHEPEEKIINLPF